MLARALQPSLGETARGGGSVNAMVGLGEKAVPGLPVWDAVVVGAGPAGSMTAHELARAGKRVLLLDRQQFPRWKVCGGTLSPGAQGLLAQSDLGGLLDSLGAGPLHTLRLGGWSITADLPLNGSRAVSRSALDAALIEAAVRRGAHFSAGVRVDLGELSGGVRTVELLGSEGPREVAARVVVAADGLASKLLAQAGLPAREPTAARRRVVGLGAVFPASSAPFEPGVIHMAVGREGYAGVVQVEDGSINVAAALDHEALRQAESPSALVQDLLAQGGWPSLPTTPSLGWRGTPGLTRRPERPGAERLLAVGDAAGYLEPFTGEGVFWSLSGARLIAPLVGRVGKTWDPRILTEWTNTHARLMKRAQRVCRATSWVLSRPLLTRSALRMLTSSPRLARPIVRRVGAPIVSRA
ncbi:MAG: FAD-binding protein [Gemmatimonadetes bacterium]|nr:FAD-dependent monooxygenase [Gemmatimonadota bacterium]NNM04592.1 FAD-binding protein [Gemmatimonadota bacterium]